METPQWFFAFAKYLISFTIDVNTSETTLHVDIVWVTIYIKMSSKLKAVFPIISPYISQTFILDCLLNRINANV